MISDQDAGVKILDYEIRQCTSLEDYEACIELQRRIWQYDSLDLTPVRSFVIAGRSGGFTLGAFDGSGKLAGFAHALPAFDEKLNPYYYSNMLAIDERLQNAGLGMRLKLAQREHALQRGISLMAWTFDPLQSRNAYLNIHKLGGIVRKYLVNFYGHSSTSPLHRGLDTDRLFVEWWVGSERVPAALSGERRNDEPEAAIEIPRGIDEIKKRDFEEARRWQLKIRQEFQGFLADGLICAGFAADAAGGNSRYLFYKADILS
ncbi:MAG: GNAT family N-acetyltransferase [Blastocatellia bacterium]|nr:GNAT family N-acetyltransferase [Blastocatellia bacterium]